MARKKEKKSRVRYIGPGMSDILEDERSKKKGKKHIRPECLSLNSIKLLIRLMYS